MGKGKVIYHGDTSNGARKKEDDRKNCDSCLTVVIFLTQVFHKFLAICVMYLMFCYPCIICLIFLSFLAFAFSALSSGINFPNNRAHLLSTCTLSPSPTLNSGIHYFWFVPFNLTGSKLCFPFWAHNMHCHLNKWALGHCRAFSPSASQKLFVSYSIFVYCGAKHAESSKSFGTKHSTITHLN